MSKPALTPLPTSPHEVTLPKSQLDFAPDIKATLDGERDQGNEKSNVRLDEKHREKARIEEQNNRRHARVPWFVSKSLEWIGRTLLAILCLLLSLLSLWFACLLIQGSKEIWQADLNNGPPLPPDASAFDVFVEWPLPIFAWAIRLFTVGLCMPMVFLVCIGGMLVFLTGAVLVMLGIAP